MSENDENARIDDLHAVTALGDPNRRMLYEYVAQSEEWVSRDEAAEATGLERGTVVHHLDRLASDGLLDVDYRRLTGRQGPGAGRPAKLYRRATRDFSVSLPPREYEIVGRMLAAAVDQVRCNGTDVNVALSDAASAEGVKVARAVVDRATERSEGSPVDDDDLLSELAERGYEPRTRGDGTIVLQNCPFHHLAKDHTELVCNMNLDLLGGTLEAMSENHHEARLEPEDGLCCVKLYPLD